jgi:small-conductance mechanosensitive channel
MATINSSGGTGSLKNFHSMFAHQQSSGKLRRRQKTRDMSVFGSQFIGHVPNFIDGKSPTQNAKLRQQEVGDERKAASEENVGQRETFFEPEEGDSELEDVDVRASRLIKTRRAWVFRVSRVFLFTLAIVALFLEFTSSARSTWAGVKVSRWLLLFCSVLGGRLFIFPVFLIITSLASSLDVLMNSLSHTSISILYYTTASHSSIYLTLRSLLVMVVWLTLFADAEPLGLYVTGQKLLLCLTIFLIGVTINSFILAMTRIVFHKDAYLGRLHTALMNEHFLVQLQQIVGAIRALDNDTASNSTRGRNNVAKSRKLKDYMNTLRNITVHRMHHGGDRVGCTEACRACCTSIVNLARRAWSKAGGAGGRILTGSHLYSLAQEELGRSPLTVQRVVRHLRKRKLPLLVEPTMRGRRADARPSELPTLESEQMATGLGKRMFKVLLQFNTRLKLQGGKPLSHSSTELTYSELATLLGEDAVEELADRANADEKIVFTQEIFERIVSMIFNDRKAVAATLRDCDLVLDKLNYFTLSLISSLVLVVWLLIWDVDVIAIFAAVGSILFGFSFAFGPALQKIFQATILIFVSRPFEVNDMLLINGCRHRVVSIGLNTTRLLRYDGRAIWRPTWLLAEDEIINTTRSQNWWEEFYFHVDLGTESKVLVNLTDRMDDLVRHNKMDFETFALSMVAVEAPMKIKLCARVQYNHPGDNIMYIEFCRSKVVAVIKSVFAEANVQYSGAPLSIEELSRAFTPQHTDMLTKATKQSRSGRIRSRSLTTTKKLPQVTRVGVTGQAGSPVERQAGVLASKKEDLRTPTSFSVGDAPSGTKEEPYIPRGLSPPPEHGKQHLRKEREDCS